MGQLGGAAQTLVGSIDQGLTTTPGGAPYLYFGSRAVRGWAVAARPRRGAAPVPRGRGRPVRALSAAAHPARAGRASYLSRLAFWLFVGLAFAVVARLGGWPQGDPLPIPPQASAAQTWPVLAIVALVLVSSLAWIVARHRLIPRREVALEEELAGYTAALLMLGLVSLLVVAVNAFALVFVLPSLHAWLWLPQFQSRPIWTRAALLAAGFAGPALLVWSLSERLGLGANAAAYLVELVAIGYVPVPLVLLFLAWLGVAGQLAALSARRYAPYPSAEERPPRGPVRQLVRAGLLTIERRRRRVAAEQDARRRGLERQEADALASGQLAVAARHEHERIGCRGTHDHVRVLPAERLEPGVVAACADELVANAVPADRPRERPVSQRGPGSRSPSSARRAGRTKSSKPTSVETGLPGRPNTRVAPRTPNETGLPGLTATRQKTSSTPSSRATCRTRSCGPTDTPPELHDHVGLERARQRRAVRVVVVLDCRDTVDARAVLLERSGEHDAVRLVDLSWLERLARRAELGPRRENGDARAACHAQLGDAGRRERSDLGGAEARARRRRPRRPRRCRRRAVARWRIGQRPREPLRCRRVRQHPR